MLANPCIGAPRHRLLTGHPSQHSSGTRVPPRCSKRHRGQWVVSGELTRFSQAPQYRPASPTDRLLKRMETGRGGCCNPSPASVSDQVHQTSYPYEEAFKQDTGGETRKTSAARQTHASGGTGLGLHGRRCHSGHCVAHGTHAAVTQWLGRRITGDHRRASSRAKVIPTQPASRPAEWIPDPRKCIQESVLLSP